MSKLYTCHEADPHVWYDICMSGRALLASSDLDWYRDLVPDDKDLQDKWKAAMDNPEKYVSFLIGQKDDDEQRAERDEDNYHNPFDWEWTTQIYFLAYHEVKAHLQWVASRPAEAEAYKWFQLGECLRFFSCHEPVAH